MYNSTHTPEFDIQPVPPPELEGVYTMVHPTALQAEGESTKELLQNAMEKTSDAGLAASISLVGLAHTIIHRRAESRKTKFQKKESEVSFSQNVFEEAAAAVVDGRYPSDKLRPITNLQERQALRASRNRHKTVSQLNNQNRIKRLYGEDIGDARAVEEKISAGRYTRAEKTAMRRASRQVRRIDGRIGEPIDSTRINDKDAVRQRVAKSPRLQKSSTGQDLPGTYLELRGAKYDTKIANAGKIALKMAGLEQQLRELREKKQAEQLARKKP